MVQQSNPDMMGMLNSLLDRDRDGSALDDIFGIIRKLFGRRWFLNLITFPGACCALDGLKPLVKFCCFMGLSQYAHNVKTNQVFLCVNFYKNWSCGIFCKDITSLGYSLVVVIFSWLKNTLIRGKTFQPDVISVINSSGVLTGCLQTNWRQT